MSKTTFSEALEIFSEGLKNDPELWSLYQANIAVAFYDEAVNKIEAGRSPMSEPQKYDLLNIANHAAHNFLNLLTQAKREYQRHPGNNDIACGMPAVNEVNHPDASPVTRAKFICGKAEKMAQEGGEVEAIIVDLFAVVSDDENKSWAKLTPIGDVHLSITNPAVFNHFQIGKQYYADFSEAK